MRKLFRKSIPGTLGLEVSPFGVAAAYLKQSVEGQNSQGDCQYFEGSLEKCQVEVKKWMLDLGIPQAHTQVVLHPTMYSVYVVDRPEVEADELAGAVRFKLKDLIDTPLKDLVIDAFALPEDAYRGNQKKVYAVATQKALLEETVAQLKHLPIRLFGISISELADRALVNFLHDGNGGAALLRLRSANGTINLVDGGDLYLTRGIESGVSALEAATENNRQIVMDDLLLEVQRCLDFYESQLGKGAIRKMMLAPTRLNQNFFDQYLQGNLDLSLHQIDFNDSFEFEFPLSGEQQSLCFAAIAAACDRGMHEARKA